MLSFKRQDAANGLPGWRVSAGANVLGTIFDAGKEDGLPGDRGKRWQGVTPDGKRFGATSKPKLAEKLLAHAGLNPPTAATA